MRFSIYLRWERKDVVFKVKMTGSTTLFNVNVMASRQHLIQAFQNVVGNALSFTKHSCTMRVELTYLDDAKSKLICHAHIEDDGPGIPEGAGDDVFKMHTVANNQSSRNVGTGTGLGLSLAKEFICQV